MAKLDKQRWERQSPFPALFLFLGFHFLLEFLLIGADKRV